MDETEDSDHASNTRFWVDVNLLCWTGLPIEGAAQQQDPARSALVWQYKGDWPEAAGDIPRRNEQQGMPAFDD